MTILTGLFAVFCIVFFCWLLWWLNEPAHKQTIDVKQLFSDIEDLEQWYAKEELAMVKWREFGVFPEHWNPEVKLPTGYREFESRYNRRFDGINQQLRNQQAQGQLNSLQSSAMGRNQVGLGGSSTSGGIGVGGEFVGLGAHPERW